jgi:hypothetical protein
MKQSSKEDATLNVMQQDQDPLMVHQDKPLVVHQVKQQQEKLFDDFHLNKKREEDIK